MTTDNKIPGERFTGHGPEWREVKLTRKDANTATAWVEQVIDKRSMLTQKDRVEDVRDLMWQLEKEGEIVVHRVSDEHQPVMVKTLYGWDKKIPTTRLWHHKSCGQCGNIPGYPASLLWLMNKMGIEYLDETDQTSCTAWNYHGSGIGNIESLAAVFLRNFHQAYVAAKAQGLPASYYYPLVHCGTSFGNYKEVRGYLLRSAKLRESVTKILGKLGRLVDGKLLIPEEVVHYSEWLHVMRGQVAESPGNRLQPHPRDDPSRVPRLQDGAGGRGLRRRPCSTATGSPCPPASCSRSARRSSTTGPGTTAAASASATSSPSASSRVRSPSTASSAWCRTRRMPTS